MAPIELKSIWKTFGDKTIIQDANLAIADGEFVALVGPSGCGKSTLLRMVAGLEDVTSGEITIGGKRIDTRHHRDQNIAMVFQSYALYPNMTVAQNIGFNLRVAGRPKSEIRERVAEVAHILDLTELLDRKPAQLSGGQRQRVAMGRAMVRKPTAFLFDEPLSNLDAKLRVQMRSELKLLHQRLSTTSIYVTHDQIEAMTLADRIVVMNKGRIEQEGAPLDLYQQPRTRFVAGFIGSPQMNFMDADIIEHEDGLKARVDNETILDLGLRDINGANRSVVVGVRPEHLVQSNGPAAMTGDVALLEPTGAQTFVRLRVGAQLVTAVVPGGSALGMGQVFHADVEPRNLHVFDRASGLRLN